MTNPFDDPDGTFLALVDARGRYSLWPAFAPVPAGWSVAHGEASRQECLEFIDKAWRSGR
jgi:MbtH protein